MTVWNGRNQGDTDVVVVLEQLNADVALRNDSEFFQSLRFLRVPDILDQVSKNKIRSSVFRLLSLTTPENKTGCLP